jgi:hypothetical protein
MEKRYVVFECDGEYVLVSQASGWAQVVGTYATLAEASEELETIVSG